MFFVAMVYYKVSIHLFIGKKNVLELTKINLERNVHPITSNSSHFMCENKEIHV